MSNASAALLAAKRSKTAARIIRIGWETQPLPVEENLLDFSLSCAERAHVTMHSSVLFVVCVAALALCATAQQGITADLNLAWCKKGSGCQQDKIETGDYIDFTLTGTLSAGSLGAATLTLYYFPDPKSRLVAGSVEVDNYAEVLSGNEKNDISVAINLGTVTSNTKTFTCTFRVQIRRSVDGVLILNEAQGGVIFRFIGGSGDTTYTFADPEPPIFFTGAASALAPAVGVFAALYALYALVW